MNKIIAHRGNLNGPNPETENTMVAISQALNNGFDVEVDVWMNDDHLWLGHDGPKEYMPSILLETEGVWFHCKQIECLERMQDLQEQGYRISFFFHVTDDAVLTSEGYLWTYPGSLITKYSIAVLPETVKNWDISKAYAICTDYPYRYQEL